MPVISRRMIVCLAVSMLSGIWCCAALADQETAGLDGLEERIVEGPSIPDVVAYAYQANPSIQAARENWRAIVEKYRVVTAYPDPVLLFSYLPEPIETRLGPQDWRVTLSQGIPFPGKLSKAGEIVEADAQIARLNLDKTVRDVIVKLLESYHELTYIRDAGEVVIQNRDLLEHLRKVGETAYAQDRAALLDVVKAQSQSAQLQYDALLLEELEQTEKTQINALLNRPPGAEIGPLIREPLDPVVYELDEIYRLATNYQEEIRIAEAQVEKAESRVELARFENLPDFNLGFFYAGIGNPDVPVLPPEAGRDAIGVQFGLEIPLWLGKNAGRVGEARAEALRARAMKTSRVNDTHAQIRAIYFRLKNAERLVQLYRDELIPQAAESMEIAETWYRQGEGSFSDFIETQSVFYNFQLALARAQADYGKFLARLERLVGRSITQRDKSIAEPLEEEVPK